MASIHPTAIVDPAAELGADVEIGPFAIVEAGARLGDGVKLGPRVVIRTHTTLGAGTTVDVGAVLGGPAQDLKCTTDETFLEIGERNTIREYVTIHRSNHEGGTTRIGDDNLFMAFVHLGHDVVVGNRTMLANLATVAGHCQLDDRAVMGGNSVLHQRVRVGEMAMLGGMSGASEDIPPYSLATGIPCEVKGINVVGLRRNGVDHEARGALKTALQILYRSGKNRLQALDEVAEAVPQVPEVVRLLEFVRAIRDGHNGRQLEH